ncbi:hypothetical protein AHAS_Ahas15G0281600 [Arachis hypogaea]
MMHVAVTTSVVSDEYASDFVDVFGLTEQEIMRKENSTWKVRKVILDHNHELTPRGMVHMIAKFCRISDAAKANIDGMCGYGVSTSKILDYMAWIVKGTLCWALRKGAMIYFMSDVSGSSPG